jgi:hypothetical protein
VTAPGLREWPLPPGISRAPSAPPTTRCSTPPAPLSESDEYARTHGGTWHLFHERYVTTGAFDQHLHALAHGAQSTREEGDYEAITPDRAEAERIVAGAAEYIAAVEQMLDTQARERGETN